MRSLGVSVFLDAIKGGGAMVMKLRGKDYRKDSRFNSEWEESRYEKEVDKRAADRLRAKRAHHEWLLARGLTASECAQKRAEIKWA